MSKYYEVSEDTIEKFKGVYNKKSFSVSVEFDFIGCESQKNLIKITKIPDNYAIKLQKDLQVSINDELMSLFDDESIIILIEQELDKISVNLDTGKIKLLRPDVNTFSSLISKYGIDRVSRANQVEVLYNEQNKDQSGDDGFIA